MRRLMISAALGLAFASTAMADTATYDVAEFVTVVAGEGLEVEILEGTGYSVRAEGSGRALDRLTIDQSGDTLSLGLDRRGLERFSPILWVLEDEVSVRITLPRLEGVVASSGSDVTVKGATGETFRAQSSSGADLDITGVDAEVVRLDASSGAKLTAAGRCGTVTASASSGADLDAEKLACETADAQSSSGADLDVRARRVRAVASSGADVDIWGADEVNSDEDSGGDVNRH